MLGTVAYVEGRVEHKLKEREQFLAKALEAEKMAAGFADSFYRDSWLRIAEAYRDLAARLDKPEAGTENHP
jgi:hypothetical protein